MKNKNLLLALIIAMSGGISFADEPTQQEMAETSECIELYKAFIATQQIYEEANNKDIEAIGQLSNKYHMVKADIYMDQLTSLKNRIYENTKINVNFRKVALNELNNCYSQKARSPHQSN